MNGNKRTAHYIKEVCDQIKNKEVHAAITLELENHFAEKIEDYREAGYGDEEATRLAIAEMGDPVDVGRHLHQAHKPRMEWGILAIIGILLGVGLLILYSLQMAQERNLLERQVNGILIGTVALVAILFSDYSKLKRYSRLLYFFTLLLLLFTLTFGEPINGIPHLDIRVAALDVIYISPFLLIVAIAGFFTEWKENGRFTIVKALAYFLPPLLLLLLGGRAFAVLLYLIGYVTLLISSRTKWPTVLSFLGISLTILVAKYYMFAKPYELDRITYYLNPYLDPNGKGYQLIIQSMKAIQSAGLWGHGFGSTLNTVPALESDYIFVYLVHSLGLVAGTAFFILGIVLVARLIRTIRQVKDLYGSMLLIGIITLFFTPYFWSIFMSLGLVPPTSVTLPFVSYGNAQLILQMALMGLVLNIYRRKDIQPLTKAS